jgi:hypothetical protein
MTNEYWDCIMVITSVCLGIKKITTFWRSVRRRWGCIYIIGYLPRPSDSSFGMGGLFEIV